MTENLTFSLEAVFEEIVEDGLMTGVNSEEGYHDLVEDIIENHRRLGEINDDQNYEGFATTLKSRWPEFESRIAA